MAKVSKYKQQQTRDWLHRRIAMNIADLVQEDEVGDPWGSRLDRRDGCNLAAYLGFRVAIMLRSAYRDGLTNAQWCKLVEEWKEIERPFRSDMRIGQVVDTAIEYAKAALQERRTYPCPSCGAPVINAYAGDYCQKCLY